MIAFLDMDGVMCDFISSAMRAHGLTFDPLSYKKGEWYVEKVIGCTSDEFWSAIEEQGESFWANLDPYPWANELYETVLNVADEMHFLTSPSRDPFCLSGKKKWLKKHGFEKSNVIFNKHKYLLAADDRVLIDDSTSNLHKFSEAGGKTICIPQPWNSQFNLVVDDLPRFVENQLVSIIDGRI